MTSTDPAAQLMELRDAEPVGVEDDHDRGIRHVDSDLDHGGSHEHVELTLAERGHGGLLLRGGHPTVEQSEPTVRELVPTEPREGLLRGGDLEFLALLDKGTHHIRLLAGRDALPHVAPHHLLVEGPVRPSRHDRCSPRRELVEHGHIEIAVHRHRGGSRDRSRGHNEHIGHAIDALVAERGALLHTEAVLLIDDDQAETREVDRLLNEGVGADHQVDGAVGESSEHLPTIRSGDPVGKQLDPKRTIAEEVVAIGHRDPIEQSSNALMVLLGEHLSRRHERPLMPSLDRDEERRHRDNGLARADIALEESVHRMSRGEVGVDLAQRSALRPGERERQRRVESFDESSRQIVHHSSGRTFEFPFSGHEHGLHSQQLVEGQSPSGGVLHPHRLRLMDRPNRLGAVE